MQLRGMLLELYLSLKFDCVKFCMELIQSLDSLIEVVNNYSTCQKKKTEHAEKNQIY